MFNKFLNKIYSMEYVTDINEHTYKNTKFKFNKLYSYLNEKYTYPPYFSINNTVENIKNINVYTIEIYRSKVLESSEDVNNKNQLPKNILKLFGLPEESIFYCEPDIQELCAKIQISDLSLSPSVIPNIDNNTNTLDTNINNFVAKNIQEYINDSDIFKGNSDFKNRVNISNTSKIKEFIRKFFNSVIGTFQDELAWKFKDNISIDKYDNYMKNIKNEMYKVIKQLDINNDISLNKLKLLSVDINLLYKYFDILLNNKDNSNSEDSIFYDLDDYITQYVSINYLPDINSVKSYSDFKAQLQYLFQNFLEVVMDGIKEYINTMIKTSNVYSKYLKIIARLDDELKLSEEDKEAMSISLPNAFAEVSPEGLALIPGSYLKYLYDSDNNIRRDKMERNYKLMRRIYNNIKSMTDYLYSGRENPTDNEFSIIENGLKILGDKINVVFEPEPNMTEDDIKSKIKSLKYKQLEDSKSSFISNFKSVSNTKEIQSNIIIKSIKGYLIYLDENLDYPKSNISDAIKDEINRLIDITNSPLITSGLYYILNILIKFIQIFKIFKDFDKNNESFQSIVGKLSGMYRDFDPSIANSEIFVKNVNDYSDIILKKFDLKNSEFNMKDNYEKNIELLNEYGTSYSDYNVNFNTKDSKKSEDENEIDMESESTDEEISDNEKKLQQKEKQELQSEENLSIVNSDDEEEISFDTALEILNDTTNDESIDESNIKLEKENKEETIETKDILDLPTKLKDALKNL